MGSDSVAKKSAEAVRPGDLEEGGFVWIFGLLHAWLIGLFTVCGAVLFMLVEGGRQPQADYKGRLIRRIMNLRQKCGNDSACLESGLSEPLAEYDASPRYPLSDFHNALVYAVSVYTTIGYGTAAVSSWWGRLATMCYAALGLPLDFAFHEDMCGRLYRCLVQQSNRLIRRWRLWRARRAAAESAESLWAVARQPLDQSQMTAPVALLVFLGTMAVLLLFSAALVFFMQAGFTMLEVGTCAS